MFNTRLHQKKKNLQQMSLSFYIQIRWYKANDGRQQTNAKLVHG
jgi:hypothetical protein